jgi:hypothetical protein
MLALFETLFDIIRLRKGPDAIPYSSVVFVMVVALWLGAGLVMTIMTPELGKHDFLIGTFTGLCGLSCYAGIVMVTGNKTRLLQTVTAILGCGAILSLLFVVGNVFLSPFLSKNITSLVATLILLWSIPVEGHIIARAINRHWYVGIVAAMAVFFLQLFVYSLVDPVEPQSVTAESVE